MLRGRLLNTVWRNPWDQLAALSVAVAPRLVQAIRRAADPNGPERQQIVCGVAPRDYRHMEFTFRVPGWRVREEWITPRKQLHRAVSDL
jgi:hypothetical protein